MVSAAAALLLAASQDLIERDYALRRRLPPAVSLCEIRPQRASLEVSGSAGGIDFGCSNFDPKASFRALFDRNVREEFLGGLLSSLQSELAGSALVLACYASPTVCDAIKHYRITANAMLGMELDACRALEGVLEDPLRRTRARAIKECLDEQAARGVPLDAARRECQGASRVRGLEGRPVAEIDLLRDLGLSEGLIPSLKLGPAGIRVEARGTEVAEAFEARRRKALEAWQAGLKDPARAPLEDLGPVSRTELERIALMEPARQEAAVRSVASAKALADLVREAHAVERALEAREFVAGAEVRAELERRRAMLRGEIARLMERFEAERRLDAAVAEVQAAASAEVARKAAERLAARRLEEAAEEARERFRPWGCEVRSEGKEGRKP